MSKEVLLLTVRAVHYFAAVGFGCLAYLTDGWLCAFLSILAAWLVFDAPSKVTEKSK